MASLRAQDFPQTHRGNFNCQRPDGSVVIDVPSGFNFVIPAVKLQNTRIRELLAEGLRHNENIYWTITESFDGPEIDQIYCDRLDHRVQRSE